MQFENKQQNTNPQDANFDFWDWLFGRSRG